MQPGIKVQQDIFLESRQNHVVAILSKMKSFQNVVFPINPKILLSLSLSLSLSENTKIEKFENTDS